MRRIACVTAIAISACATSSERELVPLSTTYDPATSHSVHLTDEAQKACNTRKMRKRALDSNPNNDRLPVTVISSVGEGTRMMTDLDVDCREVFAMQLLSENNNAAREDSILPNPPRLIAQPVERPILSTVPNYNRESSAQPAAIVGIHQVMPGETLYGIARKTCTDTQVIVRLNELTDPSHIQIGDRLIVPQSDCFN